MHYRANPLPIYFPRSFESQGHIIEKRTLAQRLWTYPKVYVQSFRSLAVLLHTERENLLNTPCRSQITYLEDPLFVGNIKLYVNSHSNKLIQVVHTYWSDIGMDSGLTSVGHIYLEKIVKGRIRAFWNTDLFKILISLCVCLHKSATDTHTGYRAHLLT